MAKGTMHCRRAAILAAIAAVICLGLTGRSAAAAPPELGGTGATEITSKKVVYAGGESQVEFRGDVHVIRDDFELWCQRLEVTLSQDSGVGQASSAESGQAQGAERIEAIMAYDDVRIEMQARRAESDEAEYRARDEKLFLRGNVVLTEGKNQIRGEQVVFDLRQNTSQITAGESGQVKALFFPEKSGEETE